MMPSSAGCVVPTQVGYTNAQKSYKNVEITSQTETRLVVTCKPMYGMGLFGLALLALAWLVLPSGNVGIVLILLSAAAASLAFFLVRSTLTADKQSGDMTIESRHISGLWRKQRTVALTDIISVGCDVMTAKGASLIHLSMLLRSGVINFGLTRPHYTNGIKSWFVGGDTREQTVATKLANFVGVDSL